MSIESAVEHDLRCNLDVLVFKSTTGRHPIQAIQATSLEMVLSADNRLGDDASVHRRLQAELMISPKRLEIVADSLGGNIERK